VTGTPPEEPQPYEVKVASSVSRAISGSLPEAVAFRAIEFINGPLTENPRRVGKELTDELVGSFCARIGAQYRIVYEIDDSSRAVLVTRIGRRADVYKVSRPKAAGKSSRRIPRRRS